MREVFDGTIDEETLRELAACRSSTRTIVLTDRVDSPEVMSALRQSTK
jgi:hypothetical protein